jgi:uncharacterized Zn-binding protein involved in type VI secretion
MFPLSTKEKGDCMAMADVCKTPAPPGPPIPIPYPITAMLAQANPATLSKKVTVRNQPAAIVTTEIPMSTGDEAGAAGGVMSGMIKGPCKFVKGSSKVMIDGKPAAYHTTTVTMNGANANAPMGTQISPSQDKVIVYP